VIEKHGGFLMGKNDAADRQGHSHRGKFTEGLLDNDLILQALDVQAGQTILDAGCGNGYMSKLFSARVTATGRVVAMDPDQQFLAVLAKETKGTNIVTLAGDITRPTTLRPSSIDLLYISTVIHGFSKNALQGFFRESKRLLKPNSILAIVEIEKRETPFGPPLSSRYSPEELIGIVPLVPLNTVHVGEHFYMQLFRTDD
jgi:ubiquinone/menaquinone biosynthesis C-methylase UbiE